MPLKDFKQKSDMIRFPLWRANMKNRWRMTGDSGSNTHGFLHAIKGHLAAGILRVGGMQRKSARDRYPTPRTQKPKEGSGGKLGKGPKSGRARRGIKRLPKLDQGHFWLKCQEI